LSVISFALTSAPTEAPVQHSKILAQPQTVKRVLYNATQLLVCEKANDDAAAELKSRK